MKVGGMIHKESVISWYKTLSAGDRIGLMCNLLDSCLPWEIRFLGTFVEAQVQRDYPAFRQPESTANNPTDLSYLFCLDDAHIRRRLCVSLALLHSTNRQAAAVLFGILNEYQPSSLLEDEFFAELSLLMTMSAHHPAFSFNQKHVLRAKLKQFKQSASHTSDLSETVSESSTGSSTFSFDQDLPPKLDVQDANFVEQGTENSEENVENGFEVSKAASVVLPSDGLTSPQVYINELKVQGIEKRAESRTKHESKKRDEYEYILQVSWSDDTCETLHRSYEEMFDFQCKLRKMYPNKVDENGHPWKLPFLPGRIRLFNRPEQKGERTPIPDITDYARLFGSLPKFVRGCDHVVKFFRCSETSKTKHEGKKSKGSSKREESSGKVKNKEFESPHKLAEAVREQSLGGKDDDKKKSVESIDGTKPLQQQAGESSLKKDENSSVEVDENGNEVKLFHSENWPEGNQDDKASLTTIIGNQGKNGFTKFTPQKNSTILSTTGTLVSTSQVPLPVQSTFSVALQYATPLKVTKGLHSSSPCVSVPSSPGGMITSYPSPSPSPNTSPVTSLSDSPLFSRRSYTGNMNWTFRPHGHAMTVYEWLRSLRLHKYSEVFRGKTFDEMLKLSDKDFEAMHLTAGARRKLRVNIEVLRARGCFTSNGLTVVDILPSLPSDITSPHHYNSAITKGVLASTSLPYISAHPHLGYNSDSEFLYSVSESDSASDCGSDVLSEPGTQTSFSSMHPRKCPVLNGCHLSCYNCGSLGHVGGQCMAPNLDNRTTYGYHFKCDGQQDC